MQQLVSHAQPADRNSLNPSCLNPSLISRTTDEPSAVARPRTPHCSHSVLWVFVRVCGCVLVLEYPVCVCKSLSTVFTYVNPKSFVFSLFLAILLSSSSLFMQLPPHLSRPWHWISAFFCPFGSEGKCSDVEHWHICKTIFFLYFHTV